MTAATTDGAAPAEPRRVVIAGAGLAAAAAAQELRRAGYAGALTVVGEERHLPYDRVPMSKSVAAGAVPAGSTALPQVVDVDAEWRLGEAVTGLDRSRRTVALASGGEVAYDRLLIATGVRARSWPVEHEAALDGVLSVRTREDGAELARRLAARPRRVLVIGAGFIGSEVASSCRHLGIDVTVLDTGAYPLVNALGEAFGTAVADLQRQHGVDLRMGTSATSLEGDDAGRLRRVHLTDGDVLDVDLAVVGVGASRNVGWLEGSGLVADRGGITCDASLRVVTAEGGVDPAVCAAGDVTRWPHPVYDDALVAVEHWGTAVEQGRVAARTLLGGSEVYRELPRFWSNQFGVNIKSIGIPRLGDTVQVVQGSLDIRRGVVAYGHRGRLVGVTGVDSGREVEGYVTMVEQRAAFPLTVNAADHWGQRAPEAVPARFPRPGGASHDPTAVAYGPTPSDPAVALGISPWVPADEGALA